MTDGPAKSKKGSQREPLVLTVDCELSTVGLGLRDWAFPNP